MSMHLFYVTSFLLILSLALFILEMHYPYGRSLVKQHLVRLVMRSVVRLYKDGHKMHYPFISVVRLSTRRNKHIKRDIMLISMESN